MINWYLDISRAVEGNKERWHKENGSKPPTMTPCQRRSAAVLCGATLCVVLVGRAGAVATTIYQN